MHHALSRKASLRTTVPHGKSTTSTVPDKLATSTAALAGAGTNFEQQQQQQIRKNRRKDKEKPLTPSNNKQHFAINNTLQAPDRRHLNTTGREAQKQVQQQHHGQHASYSPDENRKLEEIEYRAQSSEKRSRTRTTSSSGLRFKNRSEETLCINNNSNDSNYNNNYSDPRKLEHDISSSAFHQQLDRNVGTHSAPTSSFQGSGKPLQRRVSWGRSKIHEVPAQTEYKRAGALGLPCLEKDLLPSLRDTVDKMTSENTPSIQSNRTRAYTCQQPSQGQGRPTTGTHVSEITRMMAPRLSETPCTPRHDVKTFNGRHCADVDSSSKSGDEIDTDFRLTHSKIAIKPKSSLKTFGMPYTKSNNREYASEDMEDSESSLSTPRLRSLSRAVSPRLDAPSSARVSPSCIPSPKFRDKMLSPRPQARSPMATYHSPEQTSYSPRSPHLSNKNSYSKKLPVVDYADSSDNPLTCRRSKSREVTPKLKSGKLTQTETYYDDKSEEYLSNYQSVGRSSPSTSPFQPSPKPDEVTRRSHRQPPITPRVNGAQGTREHSHSNQLRQELNPISSSDDSRKRRKNELVDLVSNLGIGLRTLDEDKNKHMETASLDESGMFSSRYLLATPKPRNSDSGIDSRDEKLLRPNLQNADANRDSLLMLNSERQKEAFGIPSSTSKLSEGSESLLFVESNTSIKNLIQESDYDGEDARDLELSMGAEKLFRTLAIGADSFETEKVPGKKKRASWRSSMIEAEKYLSETMLPGMTPSSSSSSIYQEDVPERPWQKREQDSDRLQNINSGYLRSSWKKTLPNSAYISLKERYGEQEMLRQEVIWDLCETENTFSKSLRTALKIYIQPLLGKNRKWVPGLPSNVTRLMDWLDDIYQLHSQINSSLRHARSKQYPIILKIAETLRPFIPRLEVYQPYIARLDETVEEIEKIVEDPQSELGEFFRIQSTKFDCDGMSLCSLLWLPLTRLGRFLKYFNELWVLTPRTHVDHLPTFSLLHSTTMVIRVMREVKIREEEYLFVKDLVHKIHGLPGSVQIAQRERKLIAHGAIQRIHLTETSKRSLDEGSSNPNHHTQALRRRDSRIESRRFTIRKATSLDSLLSDAPSITSLSSMASTGNYSLDGDNSQRQYISRSNSSRFSRNSYSNHERAKSSHLYAFIFNDLAVFTAPVTKKHDSTQSTKQGNWEILNDIGICRVLSISDHSGKLGYDHLIGVHVLPLDVEHLDNGVSPDTTVTSFYLHLSESTMQLPKLTESRQRWRTALEQCCNYTLFSLSFPAHSGHYLTQGPSLETEDSTNQSIMSILASGLPLPKSPSVQMKESRVGDGKDNALREREERGWWVLRFQQTLKEMQKSSLYSHPIQCLSPASTGSSSRKVVSSRRRLRLGAIGK